MSGQGLFQQGMFRQCGAADAAALTHLHSLCFAEAWSEGFFQDLLARPTVLAYGVFDPATASAMAVVVFQGVTPEKDILTVMTAPQFQCQGLATQVLAFGCDTCRDLGIEEIFLEVAVDNSPALHLYEKLDFNVISRRPQYYKRTDGGSVDALVMKRLL